MKIAVLGGGISGLVAAHLLSRQHEVLLFEAAPELGGHTYTVRVHEDGRELALDMGFIVFNDWTYPSFVRLLAELGVASEPSSMSFSVRCEKSGLEYNGSTLSQLFAQRRNLVRPSFYRMLFDVLRFNRAATALLEDGDEASTLGELLRRERFGAPFIDHYLVPMTAAIWSTDPARMFDFPALTLAAFLHNHGLLTVDERPQWRVVQGGSRTYVDALRRRFRGTVAAATPIEWIRRRADGVEVKPRGGAVALCDAVVVATHSDQALALLADPTPAEREILGAIPYQASDVVLHTDVSMLPRRRRAWGSWNYHLNTQGQGAGARVTYYMNMLQNLRARRHYCVTLNRTADIDPRRILERVSFAHPLYTVDGVRAQRRWAEINGGRTFYCGAYWGYGFHEDGVESALRVARAVGFDVDAWRRAA